MQSYFSEVHHSVIANERADHLFGKLCGVRKLTHGAALPV